jgi:hypothetical protein
MSALELELDTAEVVAGGVLSGRVRLAYPRDLTDWGIELLFVWHTEGKGRRDEGRDFRAVPQGSDAHNGVVPFAVTVPSRPWTYDGQLVKIRWDVSAHLGRHGFGCSASLPLTVHSPFAGEAPPCDAR